MNKRAFKYYPEDFGALNVKVLHMDLVFDMFDDHSKVTCDLHLKTLENPVGEVKLDSKNLMVLEAQSPEFESTYRIDEGESKIILTFTKPIPKETTFTIHTKTVCKPTRNVLEGLYYDETPPGCPPTQITQCQQWGFQRIVPCFDDMTAKCTYKTTIVADNKYTNMLTNGDVSKPRHQKNQERDTISYDNMITPMATYLFFLGVGTYATFKREFEYPNGDTFMLELLVPPKSDKEVAMRALDVLHDSILWVHIFTGEGKYDQPELRHEMYTLIHLREKLKEQKAEESTELTKIRKRLKELAQKLTLGYKYTGKVYREIGMQNSDFGGMENVGNTTISTNRIMPFPQMTDPGFEYMIRVKVHEYYHNLNGSEVTGRSPFEIWLNEAVTVHIEKEYHEFLFGEDYSRLQTVLGLLDPATGTLRRDLGALSMPIEPDGFNDTNELITGITYVKAPEFVRMIETLMGKEQFVKGLALYHSRYKHGNASRAQWIQAMEEVAKTSFTRMAEGWLKQTAYPVVTVTHQYDEETKVFTLELRQEGYSDHPWEFPFIVALCDKEGKVLAETTKRISQDYETISFTHITEKPEFLSLNRGYSFYGKVKHAISNKKFFVQARKDTDVIGRYMAFYTLADREKMRLLQDPNEKVSPMFLELYHDLLTDKALLESVGAHFLMIFESVEDEAYAHHYDVLYAVKEKILRSVAEKYTDVLEQIYQEYSKEKTEGTYLENQIITIKRRQIKNLALALLARLDTPNIHMQIKQQFTKATNATDKLVAFMLYLNSSAPDAMELMKLYESQAKKNLVSWEAFLVAVAGNDNKNGLAMIKEVENSQQFRIEQANDQRSLYGRYALNRKRSLLTPEGRAYLQEIIQKLTPINEYTTLSLLAAFGNIDKMEEKYQRPLVEILGEIIKTLDQNKTPSVYNNIRRILASLPKEMIQGYEEFV